MRVIAVQKDVRTLSNFFHVLKNLVKESKNVLTLMRKTIIVKFAHPTTIENLYYAPLKIYVFGFATLTKLTKLTKFHFYY